MLVERMVLDYILDTFTDFTIEWPEVAVRRTLWGTHKIVGIVGTSSVKGKGESYD